MTPHEAPRGKDWHDRYGNTPEQLIQFAVCGIVNSNSEAWEYDPELYPAWAVRKATERLHSCAVKFLPPVPIRGLEQKRWAVEPEEQVDDEVRARTEQQLANAPHARIRSGRY